MATVTSSKRQLTHTSNTYESNGDVTIGGNLNINGTTTTIDTANLLVEDKNIIIGDVSSPTDTTADFGGITLKGATDKTINWVNSTDSWTFNQNVSVPSITSTGSITTTGTITGGADFKATGNNLRLFAGGNHILSVDLNGKIYPSNDNAKDLGYSSSGNRFRNLHMTGVINGGATWNGSVIASAYLDADTAHLSGSNSFTNSYNEFGNSTGNVSNDGSWNARLNVAGSAHARLDVKSVSDGIITTMYSHTGHAAGRIGTMSNHKLTLMIAGNEKATLNTDGTFDLGSDRVFADNYHPNADTLTTARTIAGTSFNGSANISISYNNLTNKPTIPSAYSLPAASSSTRGGVKIGFSESGKNYPVEVSSEKMYVNVPWSDTNTNTTYSAGTGISLSGTTFSLTDTASKLSLSGGTMTGDLQVNADVQSRNNTVDDETLFAITDSDTTDSIRAKFYTTSTTLTKVDDSTAPASGVFKVTGGFYATFGEYIPMDAETEIMFECWVKHVSGTDSQANLYAGGEFYNGSKSSYGNVNRYWGANGDSQDSDNTTWRHIKGVMKGSSIRAQSSTSDAQYMRLLVLLNYNAGSNATHFCGMKWARSKKTVSSLWLKTSNSNYNSDSALQNTEAASAFNVIDTSGNIKSLGTLTFSASSGTMINTGAATDAFGYNSNYGHYIRGNSSTYIYGNGTLYTGGAARTLFHDTYHPNADTLTTARTIALSGAVTGSASFNGGSNITIATTATADPTLTLSGDATGSATFTNLGNATLSVSVVNDSHTHTKLAGFSQQVEYDLIRAGNSNGLYMKARWDGATSNRYWDMGYVDGYGTFYTGLKVISGGDITYQGNKIFHDTYHPNADTLTTTRNIALAGDVTGSVNFNGSSNVSITTTLAANSVAANEIAANAVGSSEIAANAVGASEIAANAVGASEIAANAVGSSEIAAGAVGASEIGNDVVNSQHYAAGSIDNEHIADNAINSEHYADGSIDNAHIADNAINSEHYASNSIDALHLNVSGNGTTSQYLRSDGDGTMSWVTPPNTNTTYSGGTGITLSGTTFNLTDTAAKLSLSGGTLTGTLNSRDIKLGSGYHLMRSNHHSGHLEGSYDNVGDNGPKSNPIYTIGSSYNPADASLSNMYGIGYTHAPSASFISRTGAGGWGMYVAADGDARVWLDGSNGVISSTGQHYVGSSKVFHDTYHPNADILTTTRNIALAGDVTGNVNFNGSGNVSISTSLAANSVGSSEIAASAVGASEIAANAVGASEIAASAVGASELNVSGNGSTSQFLRSDGDGTFTWATPTDTNTDTNTTYSAGTGLSLSGTTFSITDTISSSASNNTIVKRHSSGYIFANYFNTSPNTVSSGITQICVETGNDGYIRHGTAAAVRSFINVASGANNYSLPAGSSSTRGGFKIGYSESGKNYPVEVTSEKMYVNVPWTDTNTDTNTTYSAGRGLDLSGTQFQLETDLRDSISYIGYDSNDYIQWSNNSYCRTVVNGTERLRVKTNGIDVTGLVQADYFRTDGGNTNYSIITRNNAGNAVLYVQSANTNTNQLVAMFTYGSTTAASGSKVLVVGKDKSYFDNTKLGIGTTSPSTALHVSGTITHTIYNATSLPSASPAGQRAFAYSYYSLASSHGSVVNTNGSYVIPVYSDGSSWRAG